jgi:hypothetical protein
MTCKVRVEISTAGAPSLAFFLSANGAPVDSDPIELDDYTQAKIRVVGVSGAGHVVWAVEEAAVPAEDLGARIEPGQAIGVPARNNLIISLDEAADAPASGGGGGSSTPVAPYDLTPLGYQQIADGTLAAATALTVPEDATFALVQAEGVDVRWRDAGGDPTAAVGMVLPAGAPAQLFSGNLAALKFIRTVAGATLNVSYYS